MKKLFILAFAALGMLACTEPNNPDNPSGDVVKDGALPGKFSIGNNKQIQFSQGNLQYQASTNTWRFAEQQCGIIGEANKNISSSYSGWIDLFCWNTSNNPLQLSSNYELDTVFTDWCKNKISNGGNKAWLWRTLTPDEWDYLMDRSIDEDGKEGLSFGGKVNGISGYIILPDAWATPEGLVIDDDDDEISYSQSEWQKMQAAGAVFLPAAGDRSNEDNIEYVGTLGIYWLSHFVGSTWLSDAPHADAFGFETTIGFTVDSQVECSMGCSVRLVKDVE